MLHLTVEIQTLATIRVYLSIRQTAEQVVERLRKGVRMGLLKV
jgi:hypothetical protein